MYEVELDPDHKQDSAQLHAPWLTLSSNDGGKQRASSCAQAQGEVVTVPSTPAMSLWPEQGYNMVTAEGSSQHRRNVLLHGREEIMAKECAVPGPGPGERERNQQAGKINSMSPRATRPQSFWSQFFFFFSLLNKT